MSSESDQDFLETCRAATLLGELEDEEELPDPDEDENEDEEDNDDDEDYEDVLEEDGCELRNGKRRSWDDEFVLKRQFSALIPAFDPRPGRNNVNQTSDLDIPPPGSEESSAEEVRELTPQPRLSLTLKGPNLPGVPDLEVDLIDPDWTIFRAVQQLVQASEIGSKQDKIRRIWEPTYFIVYKAAKEDVTPSKEEAIKRVPIVKAAVSSKSKDILSPSTLRIPHTLPSILLDFGGCSVDDVLQLLRLLSTQRKDKGITSAIGIEDVLTTVTPEDFISKKLTNKLVQQIQDPLVLSSGAQPEWCEHLTYTCPMLFPFETRQLYFSCTAFGASRSIVWLQNQRDASVERHRGPSPRRDDPHEFRVGRLKHERVKVPRGEQLLEWAIQVMKHHAEKKSILEVEFEGEEGTGLGPTLEFYALVAGELQRRDLGMWLCEDMPSTTDKNVKKGESSKPPGYYIHTSYGLFPAPLPQDSEICNKVSKYFHFLGVFLAKALQDNRLVDLPLSRPFLKLICQGDGPRKLENRDVAVNNMTNSATQEDLTPSSEDAGLQSQKSPLGPSWFVSILTHEDFMEVNPHQARFLQQLRELSAQKQRILADNSLSREDRMHQLHNLTLPPAGGLGHPGLPARIDDLGLTFQFCPPSRVYGFQAVDLKRGGEHEEVTLDNIEEYTELLTDFCLHSGIRHQMESFKSGFCRVFPIEKLGAFSPEEVRLMLCGEQNPIWSRDDVLNYTEPKLGFTRESPGFQRFVNVLMNMTGEERKAFLQFTTGCSSLPPGGLANLHPRLTVVRKVDASDGSYPSVNTCAHYLKMPDYSTEAIMRERLLAATKEKGFHLN